jgi:hypothetical protein
MSVSLRSEHPIEGVEGVEFDALIIMGRSSFPELLRDVTEEVGWCK